MNKQRKILEIIILNLAMVLGITGCNSNKNLDKYSKKLKSVAYRTCADETLELIDPTLTSKISELEKYIQVSNLINIKELTYVSAEEINSVELLSADEIKDMYLELSQMNENDANYIAKKKAFGCQRNLVNKKIRDEGYSLIYEFASIILKSEFADMCELKKQEKIDLTKRLYIPSFEEKNEECCIFIKEDSGNLKAVFLPEKLQELLKQIWKLEENVATITNKQANFVSFNDERNDMQESSLISILEIIEDKPYENPNNNDDIRILIRKK